MAKLRSVIGSGFVGRIGNVVGVRGKGGEYVIRARAEEVKNPNTKRQQSARGRLTVVSRMAAALAPALELGYAKAVQGTVLTPRTAWLKLSLPKDANGIMSQGAFAEVTVSEMKISKRYGIMEKPIMTITPAAGNDPAKVSVSNLSAVAQATGMRIGIVYVFMGCTSNGEVKTVRIMQDDTGTAKNVPAEYATLADQTYVAAFFKEILDSGTEITSNETPWKYPSATSENCDADILS